MNAYLKNENVELNHRLIEETMSASQIAYEIRVIEMYDESLKLIANQRSWGREAYMEAQRVTKSNILDNIFSHQNNRDLEVVRRYKDWARDNKDIRETESTAREKIERNQNFQIKTLDDMVKMIEAKLP